MPSSQPLKIGRQYLITGIVQGVGFRPFIANLAASHELSGFVRNTTQGVEIKAFAAEEKIEAFEAEMRATFPPLAQVDQVISHPIPLENYPRFEILESVSRKGEFLPIPADVSICSECLTEILDPADRRYHYPFNNCIHCGPRYTIIRDLPYDRPNTAMADFVMCKDCQNEYENPENRRFHAQPTGCPACGPSLTFLTNCNPAINGDQALVEAAAALRSGKILALKGLGGFHLACDPFNVKALARLREIKLRSRKAFALMASDLDAITSCCVVSAEEEAILSSPRSPIVLLSRRSDCSLPSAIAPGQKTLGIMLPYTPLHRLLFDYLKPDIRLLVMTSANRAEEPIICGDTPQELEKLAALCDCILTHNRPIVARIDDSVVRSLPDFETPLIIRRARGYAPEPIRSNQPFLPLLAVGPELKNTFCLTKDRFAFLSPHIGDLENAETLASFSQTISHYQHLFRTKPEALACDLHPDYLSTRYAEERSKEERIPLIRVQHHYAHIAAVLAEQERFNDQPALGLAFDGTGYGADGTIWGGEALFCNSSGFERLYHLEPFLLAGGDQAVRSPARQALGLLHHLGIPWEEDLPPVKALKRDHPDALNVLAFQLNQRINCVQTSSVGRFFDAVAALIGICQRNNYEGQAAIELENAASPDALPPYPLDINSVEISTAAIVEAILADYRQNAAPSEISARFHQTLIQLSLELCIRIREKRGSGFPIVLSGGVWQNMQLLTGVTKVLKANQFEVLIPRQLPVNDGCIAFGQAVIADAILKENEDVSRNSR